MNAVFRCYSEKKQGFDIEATQLLSDLKEHLMVESITSVRILNRYDVEGITAEEYAQARSIVFSEPQCDNVYDETFPPPEQPAELLAIEALRGQYDQRADSCSQCIQSLTRGERPLVRTAKVYLFGGVLSEADKKKIRGYIINPVDTHEASM